MSVTADVSKLETSREINDEQPENIEPMLVTLDVSKLETSREVNDEQP